MPTPRGRVIVIGSSNTDLIVTADRLPVAGETVLGDDLRICAGGKGANQAVAAARAGAAVIFIGAFGADAFGEARKADLVREGIDVSRCVTVPRAPSGVALIGVNRDGENLILVSPGANMKLKAWDVRRMLPKDLKDKDVILASLEVPLPAIQAAFVRAIYPHTWTVLNPGLVRNSVRNFKVCLK